MFLATEGNKSDIIMGLYLSHFVKTSMLTGFEII